MTAPLPQTAGELLALDVLWTGSDREQADLYHAMIADPAAGGLGFKQANEVWAQAYDMRDLLVADVTAVAVAAVFRDPALRAAYENQREVSE